MSSTNSPRSPWLTFPSISGGATSVVSTTLLSKRTNTSPYTAAPAGPSQPPALWVTESRSSVKPNGLMSSSALKSSFPVKIPITDATEVTPELPTHGFIRTTSLTKLARPIKHTAETTVWVAHPFSSARTAHHSARAAGPKKEPKYTVSKNTATSPVRPTSWTKSTNAVQSAV